MGVLYIIFFCIYFSLTLYFVWRRDVFYGGYYIFLFIYVIFFIFSYLYYPAFSEEIGGFFGYDFFLEFYLFIFLSFLSFLFFLLLLDRLVVGYNFRIVVGTSLRRSSFSFSVFVLLYASAYSYFLFTSYDGLSYDTFSSGRFFYFGVFFKYLTVILYLSYFLFRVSRSRFLGFLFVLVFLLWGVGVLKIGSRTDVLSFLLGYAFLNIMIYRLGVEVKFPYLKYSVVALFSLASLIVIELYRGAGISSLEIERMILVKDYFAPSHVLMASIYYDLVDPIHVIKSNLFNFLFGLGYPYLQTEPGNMMLDGSSSRSTGYAMYVFSEGYMFSGFLGFLYNGFVVSLFLIFTRRIFKFRSLYMECFWVGLISMQIANLVRGQTMYFMKDIYTIYLPILILLILVNAISWRRRSE